MSDDRDTITAMLWPYGTVPGKLRKPVFKAEYVKLEDALNAEPTIEFNTKGLPVEYFVEAFLALVATKEPKRFVGISVVNNYSIKRFDDFSIQTEEAFRKYATRHGLNFDYHSESRIEE